MLKLGVLASGRGSNLQAIIDAIQNGDLQAEIAAVVSDRKEARALQRAEESGIAAFALEPGGYDNRKGFERAVIDVFEKQGVELVVMAGFMRILSPYFLSHYQNRVINIHPSLLPAFPGLEAQQQALDYGVKVSGCTVHFADEGMDTGPIILQKVVPVREGDTPDELAARILKEEHRLYPEAVRLYSEGRLQLTDGRVKILEK